MAKRQNSRGGRGHSRKSQYPGITRAARTLGVSHSHLWRVLSGQRCSFALRRRYAQWVMEQGQC
jgi:hypothetical protein